MLDVLFDLVKVVGILSLLVTVVLLYIRLDRLEDRISELLGDDEDDPTEEELPDAEVIPIEALVSRRFVTSGELESNALIHRSPVSAGAVSGLSQGEPLRTSRELQSEVEAGR